LIPYSNSKPADLNLLDRNFNSISIFGTIENSVDNVKNNIVSLNHMAFFINKRNIAIIWIDIWDIQSGSSAQILINRSFNMESYIATICGVNMNPGMLQCKNCWKWEHMTFTYRIQGSKYIKFNRPYKIEHHHHFA